MFHYIRLLWHHSTEWWRSTSRWMGVENERHPHTARSLRRLMLEATRKHHYYTHCKLFITPQVKSPRPYLNQWSAEVMSDYMSKTFEKRLSWDAWKKLQNSPKSQEKLSRRIYVKELMFDTWSLLGDWSLFVGILLIGLTVSWFSLETIHRVAVNPFPHSDR